MTLILNLSRSFVIGILMCGNVLTAEVALTSVNWPGDLDSELNEQVRENEVVGVAVGVVADGKLVFAEGYGVAELGGDVPITQDSVFHWASVSKPFVAVAIMQLVEKQALTLDDLLVDWLPYFTMADPRYREITLRQLLTHTAGMPDVEDYEWNKPQSDEAALKRWALEQYDAQLLFAPGKDRKYSNIGFELLGLVIQEAADMSFEDYMAAQIFVPLGMNNSSFIASDIDPERRVRGHTGEPERHVVEHYPYNRRHAPSSTLNTSIADMSRFASALLNNGQLGNTRILTAGSIKTMWSPAWVSRDDPKRQHGLGWNVGERWGGIEAASHGGWDDGFRSFLYVAPEEGVAVFVVSNDETIAVGKFVRASLTAIFPEHAAATP